MSKVLLPKKLTRESKVNLVYTSSLPQPQDEKSFRKTVDRLKSMYPATKVFETEHTALEPRYLAASERERLRKFRLATNSVNWLLPTSAGTGCADIVRHLNPDDLADFRRERPIVNGFSDTTFLINYLYFKLKLLTFHFINASGLFNYVGNTDLFFDIIQGNRTAFSFHEPDYKWLTSAKPQKKLEGIAIGGNFSTFRDLLDIANIRPRSWEPYILFIEELDADVEDLHRLIIALDERGVFRHIVALVVGRLNDREHASSFMNLQKLLGKGPGEVKETKNVFEYLISDVIADRIEQRDPLYILKVNNFGHGALKNTMIIPIGAKTVIHPNGRIEFIGPFVDEER
jgi:muramoyltetrapeptide carboxypeptidase LdcA involved in peptidoglycan recycling